MITSKVASKGQVTIPAEIREKLGLHEGDVLVYEFDEQTALLGQQVQQCV